VILRHSFIVTYGPMLTIPICRAEVRPFGTIGQGHYGQIRYKCRFAWCAIPLRHSV
jgi:hypothetical protein